jgi:hypothetical protein
MVKKETLKLSRLDKDENVLLYTIVSAESDLQVCRILNNVFGIGLSLADDIIINNKAARVGFRKYFYENEEGIEKCLFFVNRNQNNYLMPELKKIDYIFIIVTESSPSDFALQVQQLKTHTGISAVFYMDPSLLKSFHRIQF